MSEDLIEKPNTEIMAARDPSAILAEARKAATALMEVVKLKKKPVVFNGEQYIEFEDWQTVAKFYGITARVTNTTFIDYGGVHGFEAGADAIGPNGAILSHADAMCLNDEDNWSTRAKYEYENVLDDSGNKIWVEGKGDKKGYYKSEKKKVGEVPVPLFQLRSMAQTRACAKVLRNILAWVVVLAGYKPSVAEEMTGDETPSENSSAPLQRPQPKAEAFNSADFREMKSKFAGQCKKCEKKVAVGETILYNSKIKGVYHPECLKPKEEPPQSEPPAVTPGILKNLEKMAQSVKVNLIDRIGRDGLETLDQINPEYAQELLEEFAAIMDEKK